MSDDTEKDGGGGGGKRQRTVSTFVQRDAASGLRAWPAAQFERAQLLLTSPPYFGCRDYAATKESGAKAAIGVSHTGASDALGHEATPFDFARNLAAIFGDARTATTTYLQENGSLVIVIGDTFARATFTDPAAQHPPIAVRSAIGIQHLLTAEMRRLGWRLWQEVIWAKPSALFSGAGKIRNSPSHEYMLWFDAGIAEKPKTDMSRVREEGKTPAGTVMAPAGGKKYGDYTKTIVSDGKRARQDVWTITSSREKGSHIAPFPRQLARLWIEATTDPDDVVCDPFAGTRTVEKVALELGRRCVSFDLYNWKESKEKQ